MVVVVYYKRLLTVVLV